MMGVDADEKIDRSDIALNVAELNALDLARISLGYSTLRIEI